jgi:hypothetical protein
MININNYKPKETKFKKIIKKHGISVATVANYLGLSYPYVCNVLNGVYRMTPVIEKKLHKLANQLEEF